MDELKQVTQIDFQQLFLWICLIFIALGVLVGTWDKTIGRLLNKLGVETKRMRQKREDHELLIKVSENLVKLQERHEKDEEEFRKNLNDYMEESRADRKALHDELTTSQKERNEKIEKLTQMFLDKEIDDMRWEILNFCSALTNGRKYNREAFGHVLKTYDKYEIILKENDMENGLVEQSMEFIKDAYQEGLKNNTIN